MTGPSAYGYGACAEGESPRHLAIAHPAPVDAVSPLRQVLLPAAR